MTAAATKTSAPIIRNAAGEPPLGIGGLAFRDDQGEMFEHDNPRYRSPAARVVIFELDNGTWLAGSRVDGPQFDSREKALRYGIAEVVRRARRYAQNGTGEGTHWEAGYAGRVIEWALSIKPVNRGLVQATSAVAEAGCDHPVSGVAASTEARVIEDSPREHSGSLNQPSDGTWCDTMTDKMANEELTIAGYEASDAGAGLSDPVVKYLVEQHGLRKQFPAKHIFSMTTEVVDGRIVSVATCTCKHVFKFGSNDYLRTNAAIEAHWRRFSHEKKVDGRGQPIGEATPASKTKKSRKKSQPGAGGPPAPIIAEAGPQGPLRSEPALDLPPLGAGSLISEQVAPIGAPEELPSGDTASLQQSIAVAGTDGAASASASQPSYLLAPADPATDEGASGDARSHAPPAFLSASDMAAEPADDWSPMLAAALDLAWRESPKVSEQLKALLDFSKVYAIGAEVTRSVLRWHGGKWKLAPWIIEHFPPHRVYVEPFGGAGSVLMRKLPALTEIYNDLDVEVVNLFRVLRSADAPRLIEQLRLTPFGREEFDEAFEFSADQVERARRLVVRSFFAGGSRGVLDLDRAMAGFNGGSARSRGDNPNSSHARDWSNYADTLPAAVARLMTVIIENRPAIELMRQHDAEETLFYVDPPYIADTRSDRARKAYRHELDDDQHRELLAVLKTLSGMVVLSGYAHPIYEEALTDWRRIERGAMADGAQPRTEVLWINPACAAALDVQHPRLFDLATLDVANTPPHGHERG